MGVGVWGLSHPEMEAADWARFALVGALLIVNLPALLPIAAFAVVIPMLTLRSLVESVKRLSVRLSLAVCRYLRNREEQRRRDRTVWSSTELRSLLATYHHRKDLAVRAAAAV
jgi:hypothetical protein